MIFYEVIFKHDLNKYIKYIKNFNNQAKINKHSGSNLLSNKIDIHSNLIHMNEDVEKLCNII